MSQPAPSSEATHLKIASLSQEQPDRKAKVTLKPPRVSQIANAVIESSPLIRQEEVARIIQPYAPYLAADLLSCPEPDPEGEPNEQFYYSWKRLGIYNIARKCCGIEDPLLLMAEGQERGHFLHFEARSNLKYAP